MAAQVICKQCGYSGWSRRVTGGKFWVEIVLWCAFLIPGILYSLWRLANSYDSCQLCGSQDILPRDSPPGERLARQLNVERVLAAHRDQAVGWQ